MTNKTIINAKRAKIIGDNSFICENNPIWLLVSYFLYILPP